MEFKQTAVDSFGRKWIQFDHTDAICAQTVMVSVLRSTMFITELQMTFMTFEFCVMEREQEQNVWKLNCIFTGEKRNTHIEVHVVRVMKVTNLTETYSTDWFQILNMHKYIIQQMRLDNMAPFYLGFDMPFGHLVDGI